ncbi:hypothetical protein KSS87_021364 [Heliosperma pusillum]|nr:hypothetical protein KSS87_021364 [Heliosperma pusillum]
MVHDAVVVENDPLADYSFFSLNPSSLFSSVANPNFGSPFSFLKNLVVRNPDSLLNQAKTIKENSMDHVESDKTMGTVSEDNSNVSVVLNDKNPKERRPDLGRKRAKFSMKPMPRMVINLVTTYEFAITVFMYYSQPNVGLDLEPTLDIDILKDPVELFAAFERMENAKKEIRRQKGLPLEDIDQNRPSLHKRQRRPGLSRKPAVYKHRTYSLTGLPENDESLTSPRMAHDHSIISSIRGDTIPETNSSQTRESDVKLAMSSEVSELDELLSYDYEGLDEDGVESLLLDKLNIKLVNIGEPSLPDIPNVRRQDYASFIESLQDVGDSLLGSSKAASSKPVKFSNQYRKSLNIQVSPPLSKSPMASISTLNKHISRLTPLKDPFSHKDIDSSPEVCYQQKAQNKKQDDQIGTRFPANEEEINECVTSPCSPVNSRNPNTEYEEQLDGVGHSDQLVTTTDSRVFEKAPVCGEEDIGVSVEKLLSEEQIDKTRETSQTGIKENLLDIRSLTDGENNLAFFAEASMAGAKKDVGMTTAPIEEDQIAASPKSVTKEASNERSIVQVNVNEGDDEMGEAPNTQDILIIKPIKKIAGSFKSKRKETENSTSVSQEIINVETVNRSRKVKTISNATDLMEPKNKKKKIEDPLALSSKVDEQLAKHSLPEAGTNWEGGVRRSTRIRMRPLEFWRGERFIYGRVHKGLVSVIGVKYASPTKNEEERVVKVKSFLPDEYKPFVDLASS